MFSALLEAIHEAAIAPDRWESALHGICQVIGASAGGLIVEGDDRIPDIVTIIDVDPSASVSYRHRYSKMDPVIPAVLHAPEGSVVTQGMILPRSEMARTEFYNDWLRPQNVDDCLAAKVAGGSSAGVLAIAVSAQKADFSPELVQVMQLLTPHVSMAIRTHMHLRGMNLQRNDALDAIDQLSRAVLVVGAAGQVAWTNRAGSDLLLQADGLSGGGSGGVEAATSAQTAALRRLIARATGSVGQQRLAGSISLSRPSGKRPLMLIVTPVKRDSSSLLSAPQDRAIILVAAPGTGFSVSSGTCSRTCSD